MSEKVRAMRNLGHRVRVKKWDGYSILTGMFLRKFRFNNGYSTSLPHQKLYKEYVHGV